MQPAPLAVSVVPVVVALLAVPGPCATQAPPGDRVAVRFDTAEAAAALQLIEAGRAGRPVPAAGWQRLFATDGYRRLQAREAAVQRDFTDADFRAFITADTLGARAAELRRTLAGWQRADVTGAAARALAYLPADARIHATVYVMIKPRTNSFVWDVRTDPAIFLYLDPSITPAQLENTVAHELHHIGFASIAGSIDSTLSALPDSVRPAAEWLGAFGEGFAMLAAAGGPDVHPHAASAPADQARWDRDVANFDDGLGKVERFLLDVIDGRLAGDSIRAVAAEFYGVQGPWYTVGWKMAVTVERQFGRAALIQCLRDPRRLLARYNAAAGDSLARWSPALLAAFGADSAGR
jgi:hypothetical protein